MNPIAVTIRRRKTFVSNVLNKFSTASNSRIHQKNDSSSKSYPYYHSCRKTITYQAIVTRNISHDTLENPYYVSEHIKDKIKNGDIIYDKIQEKAALRLTKLQKVLYKVQNDNEFDVNGNEINKYEPAKEDEKLAVNGDKNESAKPIEKEEQTNNLNGIDEKTNENDPEIKAQRRIIKGLYIHGPVGCGKTMLMDLFHSQTTPTLNIKRIHYYKFMSQIHQHIHTIQQQQQQHKTTTENILNPSLYGRNVNKQHKRNHPVYEVAKGIASSTNILCIDEFQVTDIADAFILSQLFHVLFHKYGMILICTSNLPPEKLYENGLHRDYFLPFLDLLHKYCIVHSMNMHEEKQGLVYRHHRKKQIDYRRILSKGNDYFHVYKNKMEYVSAKSKCLDVLQLLGTCDDTILEPKSLTIDVAFNRRLHVPTAIVSPSHTSKPGIICHFTYQQLCENELGSSDYHALAQHFKAIIIEGIPKRNTSNKQQLNASRRFITLMDELYDNQCALVCTAECPPDLLFPMHKVNNSSDDDECYDIFNNGGDLASITELNYAFQRTKSRLYQMCSKLWWDHVFRDG